MGSVQDQDSSHRVPGAPSPGALRLRGLSREFDAALGCCAGVAGLEEVHRVRTGSRRLQATIESLLGRAGAGAEPLEEPLEKPGAAWLRQIKRLRRAAGPVRDLDVYRKLLARAAAAAGKNGGDAGPVRESGGGAEADEDDSLVVEMRFLEAWLGERRHDRADALLREIRKRRDKLAAREAAFFSAMEKCGLGQPDDGASAARLAAEDFARASEALPWLNAENLHRFRKLVKRARYVAESGGPPAPPVAKTLKRIQDAIGEWHDWLGLAGEAKSALDDGGLRLTAWLEGNLDRSLARALRITGVARARLLIEWSWMNGADPYAAAGRKRPPSRALPPARKSA